MRLCFLCLPGQPVGWVDGSSLAFSNWETKGSASGVKTATQQNSCAVMVSADGGIWSRVSCKDSHSRIVCKVPAREYYSAMVHQSQLIHTFFYSGSGYRSKLLHVTS